MIGFLSHMWYEARILTHSEHQIVVLRHGGPRKEDEGFGCQRGNSNLSSPAQLMASRQGHDEWFAHERLAAQCWVSEWWSNESDIKFIVSERRKLLGDGHRANLQADVWSALVHPLDGHNELRNIHPMGEPDTQGLAFTS